MRIRSFVAILLAFVALAAAQPVMAAPALVDFKSRFARGTIVIVNSERKLYYVLGDGRAIRYPVAVGTKDEIWTGRTYVSAKRENPRWIPDDDREPVEGGLPHNPLGKRALYLDWSLLRIHGSPARGSIGRAASSGCIRMLDEDVIDLYERAHIGAPVVAINNPGEIDRFVAPKVTGKLDAD